ncbi:MAG: peptide chain release factor N(5)-glutamine methyltransferase [Thermodesulfovibrionales bacterium]
MNIVDEISHITSILKDHYIDHPEIEARLILSHILAVNLKDIYLYDLPIPERQVKQIEEIVKRRTTGIPLQYLLGEVEFFDMIINVGEGVFIPRPETELMTEYAIKEIKGHSPLVLDICTGSGCIALAIAKQKKGSFVVGTDISEIALRYAKGNAKRNKINNVSFVRCDLFAPFKDGVFDVIISNPPYISSNDIKFLQREVQKEPLIALDGGDDGLDFYRRIINNISHLMKSGGVIILEIGFNQSKEVFGIVKENTFSEVRIIKDYAGIDRILIARR